MQASGWDHLPLLAGPRRAILVAFDTRTMEGE